MVRETQRSINAYKENQAISNDYSETGYDRAHLNPNSFQCSEGRRSTFTLTNAAPMDACFNRNQWAKWEKTLRIFLRDRLRSDGGSATAYIVTGTVPDPNLRIPQREISEEPERVTVPSHIWTAVCYKHSSDDMRSVIGKRDISGVSDDVECLLVPEKHMTAADGLPCLRFFDSGYSCQCIIDGKIKSCCSTPCLYQENSYRCYSGQKQIECSPRYSLITYKGEKCFDDHPCTTYGKDFYWCKKISGGWDYCSPPLWRSKAKNGKYCRSDHACAKYGYGQMWCYTSEGGFADCCTSVDCYSAVDGKTCRFDHKCGYYEKNYLWCYTDYKDSWAYCCKSC
ncbi:Endonuclease domain-containing 1 protein [Labeo rohita]|uniref:Endonuclease domain-containing 1 protein n=1 Tax=Labeo rohita TaxID=84645 RepID=A0ABQ8L6M4_LABRO|nr:Endonuclease domain-containing 1 protein [Labeo rohita]